MSWPWPLELLFAALIACSLILVCLPVLREAREDIAQGLGDVVRSLDFPHVTDVCRRRLDAGARIALGVLITAPTRAVLTGVCLMPSLASATYLALRLLPG